MDSPALCTLLHSGKAQLQQGGTSYARPCSHKLCITCFTYMNTMLGQCIQKESWMHLDWLLLEPAPPCTTSTQMTQQYSKQIIVSFAQPANDKRLLGASQSHQSDVFDCF